MKRIELLIELELDDAIWLSNEEEANWFYEEVLGSDWLTLNENNLVGDIIGEVNVLKVMTYE